MFPAKHLGKKAEVEIAVDFFKNFQNHEGHVYLNQLGEIANLERTSFMVFMDDLEAYMGNDEFVRTVLRNTLRYVDVFSRAADILMPEPTTTTDTASVIDIWAQERSIRIREQRAREAEAGGNASNVPSCPPLLMRKYEVRIILRNRDAPMKLRAIRSPNIGSLVSFRGVVIKATDVQPLMQVQTYVCTQCGSETYQIVEYRQYTPLSQCASEECKRNNVKGKLFLQVRGSKFRPYQELRVQELPSEVPVGNVPRAISVRVYGDQVRTSKPGDIVRCQGIFLPAPYQGYRAIKAGLVTDTFIHCMDLDVAKKNYNQMEPTEEEEQELQALAQDPEIYRKLAESISPEIFGHIDTKKALLLSMVGGVTKQMKDGMKIRGDINLLIVGDPGMAKSQLLKYITRLAPRAVYTTGKGSSGVGLTAAVTRDTLTGELTLEGGALVLADNGVCCIDEFDKMDENDRTAIHEVMEQQTVSIAKAGITTSLNARTTVIAAANPIYGRFREDRSVSANLDMPAALLSRFDLVFVLIDRPDVERDEALARHITYVHRYNTHPPLPFTPISPNMIRHYISRCKLVEPTIPPSLADAIAVSFKMLRQESARLEQTHASTRQTNPYKTNPKHNDRDGFVTARSLLSILRLSQALARIHLQPVVSPAHVNEALRLMAASRPSQNQQDTITRISPMQDIYNTIIQHAQSSSLSQVPVSDILTMIVAKGYTKEQFDACIQRYIGSSVWQLSRDGNTLSFIN